MAHAFDNRNFVSSKHQTLNPFASSSLSSTELSLSRPNVANALCVVSSSRQSPKLNRLSSSIEEHSFDQIVDNQLNSQPLYHSTLTSDNSTYHPNQQSSTGKYFKSSSENCHPDAKPPLLAGMSHTISTANNNYIGRTDSLSQNSSNEIKTRTTYLNATKLYIAEPLSRDNSSPHCSIHSSTFPLATNQKNSVTIPNFNSSISTKTTCQPPTVKQNRFVGDQVNSFSFDNDHHSREITNESTVGEYFGECSKCGKTVTNLDDPCDILGQLYHSSCAVCVACGRSVKNKHCFLQEQLYCEEDFLYTDLHETLEYCVACGHLITDTILQALGQSYHIGCLKCSKCSICLDGLPFMKDKNRNLFCVNDYHMIYGLCCDKCSKPIYPETGSNETVRIISMGKNFHVHCYQCEDCSRQLGNEQDRRCYPQGDTLLCQACSYRRLFTMNKF